MTPESDRGHVPSRRAVVALANLGILASLIPFASAQASGRVNDPATRTDQSLDTGATAMSAYIIFIREHTRNADEMQTYAGMVTAIFGSIEAEVLAAYGAQEVLEGPAPEGVVIAKFASMEAAQAFYHGPDYQAAVKHRFLGADFRTILVQGVD